MADNRHSPTGIPTPGASTDRTTELKRTFHLKKQPLVETRLLAQKVVSSANWLYVEPLLDLEDIQGDALAGFNKPHKAILAIDIVDDNATTIDNVKQWLIDYVIPNVTSAREVIMFPDMFRLMRESRGGVKPTNMAQTCFNVSFSYSSLLKLAPENEVKKFYKPGVNAAFKVGLTPRSTYLQDPTTGDGAANNWVVGAKGNPHILIQIASDRASLIQEEINTLEAGLVTLGNPAVVKYNELGKRRKDNPGHEHFGFLDGISQPGMRGRYKIRPTDKPLYVTPRYLHEDDSRVDLYGLPGQNLLWPGELILGLPKQYEDTTSGDPVKVNQPGSTDFIGPDWARNGTYLVYRRLRQDVVKFWDFLRASAAGIAKETNMETFTKEHLGAKVVARWKSGTPIIRSAHEDVPDLGPDNKANNAFDYTSEMEPFLLKPHGHTDGFEEISSKPDPLGLACPMSAHLRKVQPRDHSTDIGNNFDSLKRRLIRRGIEYGEPIADVHVDDKVDRGLMFVSYQASIDKQFEFLITHWANDAVNPHNGGGHDMIIGQSSEPNRERTFDVSLPGGTTKRLKTTNEWVIPTGGGYFFVPSISALKNVIAKK